MFVSRFFAFTLATLASVSFVGALPTTENDILVKRTDPAVAVASVLTTLTGNLGPPTTAINTAVTNNQVSLGTIQGPCNTIITSINAAAGGLAGIGLGTWNGQGSMPPSYTNCVNILQAIIELLVPCLGQLLVFTTAIPEILLLLVSIDVALSSLLIAVNFILLDVVLVVGSLVTNVQVTLTSLVFTLTLGCLGI